jgi:RimK family alpha-L-glutamate ligase
MPNYEIALLSYDYVTPENISSLREAAAKRNIKLHEWEPHHISIWCDDGFTEPLYNNAPKHPAVIIHRTISRLQGVIFPALRLWQSGGAAVLNNLTASALARDKMATAMKLIESGLPTVSSLAFFPWEGGDFNRIPTGGVVVKPAHGLQGRGVSFFPSREEAETAARVIQWGDASEIISEHYLAQSAIGRVGEDIRAYVVNGRCVAIARRRARDPREARANLTLGASATALPLDHPAASLAVSATEAVGLDYAGVDIVEDGNDGLKILEVDAWAGFAGLERATGADISGHILDLALDRLRSK